MEWIPYSHITQYKKKITNILILYMIKNVSSEYRVFFYWAVLHLRRDPR